MADPISEAWQQAFRECSADLMREVRELRAEIDRRTRQALKSRTLGLGEKERG